MTTEEKAKAYDDALERAKAHINIKGIGDTVDLCKHLFPQLCDSEDEKIRKFLIKLVNDGLTSFPGSIRRSDVLDYLEKQKPAEWKPQPESLEALMYAIEGKWDMISPTSYLSRRLEDLYEGLVNTYNVDESILAELPKTAYTAEDIEELKELKDKIDASMEQKPEERFEEAREKYQVEWGEEDERMLKSTIWHISNSLTNGKNTDCKCDLTEWLKEKLKSLRPSWKPSEQEKGALRTAIHILTDERSFPKAAAQLQNILNAFEGKEPRKDWKPSEEQMKALKEVAYSIVGTGTQTDVYLVQLYEQLKKLM